MNEVPSAQDDASAESPPNSTSEIGAGGVLRTSGPPDESLRDINNNLIPPANAYIFNQLSADDDARGFSDCRAVSVDWDQHHSCNGPEGALQRASGRATHTHVWHTAVKEATAPILLKAGDTFSLSARHWPIQGNAAHSHLLLGKTCSSDKYRRAAQKHLQVSAGTTLAYEGGDVRSEIR